MSNFAGAIIAWQKQHGRHDLPWQNMVDPYAIWVSEIMLQQTQVAAVIGYYANFMQRFPTIAALANASQEDVLQSWSGLGYYSRARNLHNAAQKIVDDFGGAFPTQFVDILSLPGIGRSTAAAISTFALNAPQPILDGNVKRVFARHFNIAGYTGAPKIAQKLWQIAERENPKADAIAYTQGLMDLGATLCARTKPKCAACPVNAGCAAYKLGLVSSLPTPKPRKTLLEKSTTMLVIINNHEVLLEKRPQTGIWAGLWSLPEIEMHEIATEIAQSRLGLEVESGEPFPIVNHAFTHFKLAITPQPLHVIKQTPRVMQSKCIWMPLDEAISAAIATPIRTILNQLKISQINTL
ncbi:MAG: A/G-specific adenine glycosylase [Bdellovibrio sp.]|nr:A/G-specific adenine glycosylase [Methylotenera sp.]